MPRFTVVYDACVLYPAPLRDLLMQMALADLFHARWTSRIHDEWIEAVLRTRADLKREQLERTRDLMDRNVRDGLVSGYEGHIPDLSLPDPDDRHVLAAAIACEADAIVTFNLKDFPESSLGPLGIEAIHPDEFIANELELNPTAACEAVKVVRSRLRKPAMSVEEYLATLRRQGLVETVAILSGHADLL